MNLSKLGDYEMIHLEPNEPVNLFDLNSLYFSFPIGIYLLFSSINTFG
jgi:hypothetical protein